MGFANNGSIANPHQLAESTSIRYLPGRTLHWGTDELVGLLERAGRVMLRRHQSRLTVGDLSAHFGGMVMRHRSHQSGRDADVAFFMRTAVTRGQGRPADPDDYIVFDRLGQSLDHRFVFDTARNWTLLQTLLTDRQVRVERLFVSSPLRALLLHYARDNGAPADVVTLAANTLVQPARVSPHDNHFHVRIVCPTGDARCQTGVFLPPRRPLRRVRPVRSAVSVGAARRARVTGR